MDRILVRLAYFMRQVDAHRAKRRTGRARRRPSVAEFATIRETTQPLASVVGTVPRAHGSWRTVKSQTKDEIPV